MLIYIFKDVILAMESEIFKARLADSRKQAYAARVVSAEIQASSRMMRRQNQIALQHHSEKTERALRSFGSLPHPVENDSLF